MPSHIGYRNVADTATLTTDVTIPDGYSLDSLKTRQVGEFCRFESSPFITAEWTEPQTISIIGFAGCNTAPRQPLMSVGAYSWDDEACEWVQIADASCADGSSIDLGGYLFAVLDTPVVTKKIRVSGVWEPPQGVTTYDAGRLWISNSIAPDNSVDFDLDRTFSDSGEVDYSHGEQAYESPGVRCAQMTISYTKVSTMLAWGFDPDSTTASDVPSFQDMQYAVGTTGEVVVIPRTTSALWIRRTMIYGRVTDAWGIRRAGPDGWSVSIPVRQER